MTANSFEVARGETSLTLTRLEDFLERQAA